MIQRNATAAVIGAGDYIGAAIARRFATGGYKVFAGRRNGDKFAPLVAEIEKEGGFCAGRTLDARKEEAIVEFLAEAERTAPLEVCIFNVGANVNFPLLETTERVFRKVWEMGCYAGFLTGREAARLMVPRGKGSIFLPAPPRACGAASAMPPSPPPNSDCGRWRKAWRANSGRRTFTSRI